MNRIEFLIDCFSHKICLMVINLFGDFGIGMTKTLCYVVKAYRCSDKYGRFDHK